jgi:hypothetical protein
LSVPNVVSYTVQFQGTGIAKTYIKKAKDVITNTSGQDLFSTGNPTGDYFSFEDQVSNVPFTCTISVTCADGSIMQGKIESVDLSIGNVMASSCNLPNTLDVTAVAKSLTAVKVTWQTQAWFTNYKLRYRILGSNAVFTEVTTMDTFILLTDLQLDQIYEYQIVYTCLNGSLVNSPYNTFSIYTDPSLFPINPTGSCFPPVNFSYTLNNTTATIMWDSDKDVASYILYWKEQSATNWQSISVVGTQTDIKNLTIGSTYIYNIKPVCKNSGLLGIASTNGQFVLSAAGIPNTKPCPIPSLKIAFSTDTQDVTVTAEANPLYSNFLIQIRVYGSGGTWVQMNNPVAQKMIDGLKANTVYEYQIAAFCGTVQSDFSITDTIRTLASDEDFLCGAGSGYTVITSKTPIASLNVGDSFTAADFNLKVSSLTSQSPYNGEATGNVPYLNNSYFLFEMEDVLINDAGQVYAGKIYLKATCLQLMK